MNEDKKISLAEALLMVLLNLFADAADVAFNFLALIPIVGMISFVIAPFLSMSIFAITEFWLIIRGGFGFRQQLSVIVGNLADIVPFVSVLPFKTVSVVVAIYMINHPKIASAISRKAGGVASAGASSGPGLESAAATAE